VFGDGNLIIKVLKEGSVYPQTSSIVSIYFVGKRESDGYIFENNIGSKTYDFRLYSGDALPCYDIPVSTMKLKQEILVYTKHMYAYGTIGHPPLFKPEESLLIYIKLVDAKLYSPTPEESEVLNSSTPQRRIQSAISSKTEGNKFYERKMFKLAFDQYWFGLRTVKYKEEKFIKLEESVREEIKQVRCNLYRNIAAFYIDHMGDWTEAIKYCTKALDNDPRCLTSLARRARAYAEVENFDGSKKDLLLARELDKDETHKNAIRKASQRYKYKEEEYKKRKQVMEESMAKGVISNKQKSKRK